MRHEWAALDPMPIAPAASTLTCWRGGSSSGRHTHTQPDKARAKMKRQRRMALLHMTRVAAHHVDTPLWTPQTRTTTWPASLTRCKASRPPSSKTQWTLGCKESLPQGREQGKERVAEGGRNSGRRGCIALLSFIPNNNQHTRLLTHPERTPHYTCINPVLTVAWTPLGPAPRARTHMLRKRHQCRGRRSTTPVYPQGSQMALSREPRRL